MRILSKRMIRAMGSVMEIWPDGAYAEYMPRGSTGQRIGQHWKAAGKHLKDAVNHYEQGQDNGQEASQ